MKIILTEKIDKLGQAGTILEVKNGYAKNYLIPKKKALIANKENIKIQEEKLKNKKEISVLKVTNKLSNTCIIIPVTVKENNELYITYNTPKITQVFKKLNINIKQKNIIKDIFIKKIGTYDIEIKNQEKEIMKIYLIFTKTNK